MQVSVQLYPEVDLILAAYCQGAFLPTFQVQNLVLCTTQNYKNKYLDASTRNARAMQTLAASIRRNADFSLRLILSVSSRVNPSKF